MAKKKTKKGRKLPGAGIARKLKVQQGKKFFDLQEALSAAVRHQQAGNLNRAEAGFRQVLSADPHNLPSLYNLGIIAHQTGRIQEAVQLFQKVLALNPDFPYGYNSLGILLEQLNELEEAIRCYRKAIELKPDFAEAYFNLGTASIKNQQFENAVENLRKALSIAPQYNEAKNNLAHVFQIQGNFDEAIRCYEELLTNCPDASTAALLNNKLGNVLKKKGDAGLAIQAYKKAIAARQDYSAAYYNLGVTYKAAGMNGDALQSFSRAVQISPDFGDAHRSIATLTTYLPGDEHLAAMETLVQRNNLTDEDRMHLLFGLAKAYDDLGERQKSFDYLSRGNSLRRARYTYSTAESKKVFDRIKRLFDKYTAPPQTRDHSSPVPIFILGMPRSGTSLVEQILASHDEVYGAGELDYFKQTLLTLTAGKNLEAALEVLEQKGWKSIDALGAEYTRKISQLSPAAPFITDKMPHNFLLTGFIRLALPEAGIIHCTRDAMDTCYSIFQHFFRGRIPYAYDQKELGEYYLLYRDMMEFWNATFPGAIHTINYENLVEHQEEETRKLLRFCKLPWQEQCLDFHSTARTVSTASALQVRKPLYTSSIRKWRRYEKELQPLYSTLHPEL